ncbi:ATP-binding protein [Streptosporangium sp. NPDC004379]|uniref:ATP-binding protein n=1 Tax=Streptosporangium sp. NPDC004379 TaxID=3366189 RepID=UPI0036ADC04C
MTLQPSSCVEPLGPASAHGSATHAAHEPAAHGPATHAMTHRAVSARTVFTRTAERLLPATPTSVRDARSLVRDELVLSGAGDLVDDCVLVVSELVTNAVRHGGAACALRLRCGTGHVYGELFDPGAGAPRVCEADDEATGGRGLQIVGVLTDGWGVTWPATGGKIVWFVFGAPVPHPRTPGIPVTGIGRDRTA